MRQEHRAGEKLFVDFAGLTIAIVDPDSGEVWQAQLFVAVLGASNHTYAEALPSQELPYWISAHVHAFEAFGGCPRLLVPDNLRSGVTRAHRLPRIHRWAGRWAPSRRCTPGERRITATIARHIDGFS
jgi:transposase